MTETKNKKHNYGDIAVWILIILYAIAIVAFANNASFGTLILEITGCVLLLLHGKQRYGWGGVLSFIIITFVISTFFEDLSIRTGFPFGNYHYDLSGAPFAVPYIDQVPVVVGPIYIAMGYLAWTLGTIILDHADLHLDKKSNLVLLPLISAFIMVQFDLVQDPATSTFQGMWVWENGGGFFGVPLVNFLGWFLTCYVVMQMFTLFLAQKQNLIKRTTILTKKSYWLQPVILYGLIGISYIAQYVVNYDNHKVLTDLAGQTWTISTMYETAVTVMLFTMAYTVVLCLIHIFKKQPSSLSSIVS